MPKKLFNVDINIENHPDLNGLKDVEDYAILHQLGEKVNNLTYTQMERYFLDLKRSNGETLTDADKEFDESNKEELDAAFKDKIQKALAELYPSIQKKVEEKKEEKVEEKKEQKAEEKKADEKTEGKSASQTTKSEKEEKVAEEIDKNAEKFAKNVEELQSQQKEMVDAEEDDEELESEDINLYDLMAKAKLMNKGMLPKEEIPAFMQKLEALRKQNQQNNGLIEDQLMGQRAENLQGIGEEYQQKREVTPKLVEKIDTLDAIDNVLMGITRHPKLLFVSLLLMGLNPLMAIGMAVMAAFGQSLVQELYHNLPTVERAQLDRTQPQAQNQQAFQDAQTEAYQKGMATARQQVSEEIKALQKNKIENAIINKKLMDEVQVYKNFLMKLLQQKKLEELKAAEAMRKREEAAQKSPDVKNQSANKETNVQKEKAPTEKLDEKKKNPVLERPNTLTRTRTMG